MLLRLANKALDKSIFLSFDRTGFRRHRRQFRAEDLAVDLEGRRCLVTGASSGLGKAAVRGLAQLGAEVWLLCRNEEKGQGVLEEIRPAATGPEPRLELVDLASRRSMEALLDRLGDTPIDVLIHNAGVLPTERTITEDNLELTWAVNVVAPFFLTDRLVPNLRSGSRVINVSSGGMYTQRLDLRDVGWDTRPFDGVVAYAQSKRAEVILTEMWAERLAELGIAANSMHPGWADTPGVEHSLPRFHRLTRPLLRTPEQGADTIVWLAACQRIGGESGKFFFDRRAVPTHILRRTRTRPGDHNRLWELCREQAGLAIDHTEPHDFSEGTPS